mmetsp:Transcript_29688/g.32322  ORF Transcript_29688/g.32322 Transcript_29688/m.32322 type:complete len:496 (-) Transcript_29688:12-1499(-)
MESLNALLSKHGIRSSLMAELSNHGITTVPQLGRKWRREKSDLDFLFHLRSINKARMTKFLDNATQIYFNSIHGKEDEATSSNQTTPRFDFLRPTVRPMPKETLEVNEKFDSSDRNLSFPANTPITQQIPALKDNAEGQRSSQPVVSRTLPLTSTHIQVGRVQTPLAVDLSDKGTSPKDINTSFSSTPSPCLLEEENGFSWIKAKQIELDEYNARDYTKVQRSFQPDLNGKAFTLTPPYIPEDDKSLSLRQREVDATLNSLKGREMTHDVHFHYVPTPEIKRGSITPKYEDMMEVRQNDVFPERRNQESKSTLNSLSHELGKSDAISNDIVRVACAGDILQKQICEAQERLKRFRVREQEARVAAEEEERKIKELQQRQTLQIPARESIPSLQPTTSTILDPKSITTKGKNSSSLTAILRAFHQAPDTITTCETMGLMTLNDLIQGKESIIEDIMKGLKPIPRKKLEAFIKEAREGRVSYKGDQDTPSMNIYLKA